MNKGEIMKLVYSAKELKNIDTAIPMEYCIGLDKIDSRIHCMNYNGDHGAFGKLENILEIAKERGVQIEELSKIQTLARAEGYNTAQDMLESEMFSSVVPGICQNKDCDYTTYVEPDCGSGHCEMCNTKTVQSALWMKGYI